MTTSSSALLKMKTTGPMLKINELEDLAAPNGDSFKHDESMGVAFSEESFRLRSHKSTLRKITQSLPRPSSSMREIHRTSSLLDVKTQHVEDRRKQTVTATENKQAYMQNFGIELKLPSLYILDSKFFRKQPQFIFQLTRVALPRQQNLAQTHNLDGTMTEKPYEEYFSEHNNAVALDLLELNSSMIAKKATTLFKEVNSAKMVMSKHGDLFAIYLEDQGAFKVLATKDDSAEEAFSRIQAGDWSLEFQPQGVDISFIEKMVFDANGKYLIAYGLVSFYIIHMDFQNGKGVGKLFSLNSVVFDQIYDLAFVSVDSSRLAPKRMDEANYSCFIAAKKKKLRQISVFDFTATSNEQQAKFKMETARDSGSSESECDVEEDEGKVHNLNFKHEPTEDLRVKISSDFNQIVFTDRHEKFILERQEDGFFVQQKLYQLEDQVVRFVHETDFPQRGFAFLACCEFDTRLSLLHSHHNSDVIKFPKDVEPGLIRVEDIISQEEKLDGGEFQRKFLVAGMRDNEFVLDQAQATERLITDRPHLSHQQSIRGSFVKQENVSYNSYNFSAQTALSFNWPYIAFSGLTNHIVLVNAFDRRVIKRIQMAEDDEGIEICQTFITDSHSLFVLINNKGLYTLYMMDIKFLFSQKAEAKRVLKVPILTYSTDDVDHRQFISLHIRGSSIKENYDSSQTLVVFLLHQGYLYSWSMLSRKNSRRQMKLSPVSPFSGKQFLLEDENHFYFLHNSVDANGEIQSQEIKEVQVSFSGFEVKAFAKLRVEAEVIENINLDRENQLITMLTRRQVQNEMNIDSTDSAYYFKIADLATKKITFEFKVKGSSLIGKLRSGLYTFVKGHIYYNNVVIKIRYDLIGNGKDYKENEVFDYYDDIFDLGEGMRVRCGTPLDSILSHRFVYFISDSSYCRPQKILLLPYLHDRKLFLHRLPMNTEYLYTSVRTPIEDEEEYQTKLNQSQKGDFELAEIKIASAKHRKTIHQTMDSFNSIICLNKTQQKFSVFSQNGLLINAVSFKDLAQRHGNPVATSNNGLNFVFQKEVETMHLEADPNEFFKVSIVRMNVFGMFHLKEVNILENVSSYVLSETSTVDYGVVPLLNQIENMSFEELRKQVEMTLLINDNMDLAVAIAFKHENLSPVSRHRGGSNWAPDTEESMFESEDDPEPLQPSLIYVESGSFGLCKNRFLSQNGALALSKSMEKEFVQKKEPSAPTWNQHVLFVRKNEPIRGVTLNSSSLFIWTKHEARKYPLDKQLSFEKYSPLNFQFDKSNSQIFIREVRTGSDPDVVILIIKASSKMDILIVWNCLRNFEIDTHEITGSYKILWDQTGNPYIILPDRVVFISPKASIKAYEYQQFDDIEFSSLEISENNGHRFDGDNHNWFIFKDFMAMPFSYMTFVIKEKIEREDDLLNGNVFDLEPYTYIFNKSTSLMDSQFVRSDHLELRSVLENFKEIDEVYLELLHYTHDTFKITDGEVERVGKNSPLHIAIHVGNSMSAEIILEYMTLIRTKHTRAFASIFSKLISYKSFMDYLADLPSQTLQMQKKHVFRTNEPHNNLIVAMKEAKSEFVDDHFFVSQMGELPNDKKSDVKSYPVEVVSMRIGWVLMTQNGKRFLQKVFWTENLDIYNIPTIQMIVEFLYSKQKNQLLYRIVPAYLFQFFLFYWATLYFEQYADLRFKELESSINNRIGEFDTLVSYENWLTGLSWLQLVMISLIISINVQYLKNQGWGYFLRFYSWLDIINLSQNVFVAVRILMQLQNNNDDFHYVEGHFSSNTELWNQLKAHYDTFYRSMDSIVEAKYGTATPMGFLMSTPQGDYQGELQHLIFKEETKTLRVQIIFCIILGYTKLGQFMSLTDSFAPIVDQIGQICLDIRHFVVVLVLSGLCFATCFYIIAQTQMQFDGLSQQEMEELEYKTVRGSLWYVWHNLVLGNPDTEKYDTGSESQELLLSFLFVGGGFIVMIHLLNMLIAMMGNTFTERSEVASEIRTRDHLRFVLENWHLNQKTISDLENVKYLIAAISASKQKAA